MALVHNPKNIQLLITILNYVSKKCQFDYQIILPSSLYIEHVTRYTNIVIIYQKNLSVNIN